MHSFTHGALKKGEVTHLYKGSPGRNVPTWAVRMEVPGLLWWPSWEGQAIDAQAASDLAVAEFRAKWGGVPIRVTSVCEVRA